MPGAKSFEELDCWRLSCQLKGALLSISRRPAVQLDLPFIGQLRSAARSAPSNIAEGFGRRTHADFARFLDMARGSLRECENLLKDALDEGYITKVEYEALRILAKRAGGATLALERYLRTTRDR